MYIEKLNLNALISELKEKKMCFQRNTQAFIKVLQNFFEKLRRKKLKSTNSK